MGLSLIRHEHLYQAVKEEHENHNYPVAALCKLANVSRALIINGYTEKFLKVSKKIGLLLTR